MFNLAGVVRLLKKEQDRMTRLGNFEASVRRSQLSARHTEGGGSPGGCRCQLGHGLRLPKERDGQKSERKRPNRTRSFQSGVSERSRHLREGRSPLRKERDGRR